LNPDDSAVQYLSSIVENMEQFVAVVTVDMAGWEGAGR